MSTSVTASSSLPDNPRPSRLRRFSQLRTYTHNLSSTGSQRSRNSISSRVPWRTSISGSNSPTVENSTTPCPETEPSLSRYTSAPAPSYGIGDLNSHASSTESATSTPLNEVDETPHVMARLRSASAAQRPPSRTLEQTTNSQESTPSPEPSVVPESAAAAETAPAESTTPPRSETKATIRFFPYTDTSQSSRPSLPFVPVTRTLPSESCVIRVGRYSERDGVPNPNPTEPTDTPVGFKSKVVSRKHCEFLYVNGQWHIKDVGSSSGTFLNHMRLSQPNMVSRLYSIKDGDIVQLGIDFRGGEEMIFRCVRIRIECNRSWQQKPNEFNKNTESLIKNLGKGETADYSGCRECSICLGSVLRPYQCLFMAACAHVWHYKCISRLLHSPDYPMFQCPNCRAFTDLSADVDDTNEADDTPENDQSKDETSNASAEPETDAPSNADTNSTEEPQEQPEQLPEEAALANEVENLHLEELDRQMESAFRSTSPDGLARSATVNIPGWQPSLPLSVPAGRPPHLRSDTPTSDDNPLTPRNDSGPLAFDGRAGML
ncbi:hypothetical protein N7541_001521 [Penicillium brevicompactum]|uniref:FHA domain protein n=1 Tax=Penicillium brevicompactum TaxID=5074 RepID=A0A9W9RWD9_PENBR|nr:hypothetical protein N7541_001521 [Penicillium brevicompactum]